METANETSTLRWPFHSTKRIALKIAKGELVLRGCYNKSKIWNIFGEIEDLNGEHIKNFVCCRKCGKVFNYKKSQSGNLVRHRCYAEKYLSKPKNAISIIKIESTQLEAQQIENYNSHLLKLITKWIINECKSYSVLQDTDLRAIFKEFIALGAKFGDDLDVIKVIPSLTNVEINVNEMYTQCSNRVRMEIEEIKDKGFGLTTGIWTDACRKQNYIALTIHYLKNGALTFCLLGLKSIEDAKTNLCETIEIILKDFGCELSNKSIIVTACDGDATGAFTNIKSLPCISQLLNNALKKSIDDVPEVTELATACSELFNFLHESTSSENLSDSLQSFCPHRWISIYNMFKSIENKWSKIQQTLKNQNESNRIISVNIRHLKSITKTLQPFVEAIETLEEDNDPTLHLVLIYLHELTKVCVSNESEFQDLDFIVRLKKNLQFHLEIMFTENMTILHKIALFLYPPTNKLLLCSDEQKKSIENECVRLCLENETTPLIQPISGAISTSMAKRHKLFLDFVEPETNVKPEELINQELQCYKNMRVKNSEDFDCFNWWESHMDVFPFLYKLSCCILATPASAASTQQVFTAAVNVLGEITLDARADETEIEKMIFINFNGEQDELDSQE